MLMVVPPAAASEEETKDAPSQQQLTNTNMTTTATEEQQQNSTAVNNEASHVSKTTALQQTLEISNQAMRDQIKFMSEKIEKSMAELEGKELLVQQIELEKREAYRKYEALEVQNFELQEKLTLTELDLEAAKKEARDILQNQLNIQQQAVQKLSQEEQNRQLIEADGIKLLDNSEIFGGATDDLRKSIASDGGL